MGGRDGTEIFDTVHSPSMLEDFEALGALVDTEYEKESDVSYCRWLTTL